MLPRVIVSDQDPKFTNAFWMHFARKVGKKLRFRMASISKRLENGACEWSLEPIFEELGGCGPTQLGGLCGSSGV
jgi:hypothetical protein